VNDPGGELTYRLDLLGLMQFLREPHSLSFCQLDRGKVLEAVDRADELSVIAEQRRDIDECNARAIRSLDHNLHAPSRLSCSEDSLHRRFMMRQRHAVRTEQLAGLYGSVVTLPPEVYDPIGNAVLDVLVERGLAKRRFATGTTNPATA
jgi:hypothetical protein